MRTAAVALRARRLAPRMFNTTKNTDLAWQFVKLMTTGEFAAEWAEQTGYFPGPDLARSGDSTESDDPLVQPVRRADRRRRRIRPRHPEVRCRAGEEDDQLDDPGHPRGQKTSTRRRRMPPSEMDDISTQVSRSCRWCTPPPATQRSPAPPPWPAAAPPSGCQATSRSSTRPAPGCCSRRRSLILAVLLLWPLIRSCCLSLQDYGLREIDTRRAATGSAAQNYAEALRRPDALDRRAPEHRRVRRGRP